MTAQEEPQTGIEPRDVARFPFAARFEPRRGRRTVRTRVPLPSRLSCLPLRLIISPIHTSAPRSVAW